MDVTRIPYGSKYHSAFRKICGEDPSESNGRFGRFADTYTRFEHAMMAAPVIARTRVPGADFPHSIRRSFAAKHDNLNTFKTWLNDNCPKGPPTAPAGDRKPARGGNSEHVSIAPNQLSLNPQAARSVSFTTIMGAAGAGLWWLISRSPPVMTVQGIGLMLEAAKAYRLDMRIHSGEII